MNLLVVTDAKVVVTPSGLPRVARQIKPGNVMVMPSLATAGAGEIGLPFVSAGIVDAVSMLMVDRGIAKPPCSSFQAVLSSASMVRSSGNSKPDGAQSDLLGRKSLRQGAVAALAHGHDDLAPPRLVFSQPSVGPIGRPMLLRDMAAGKGATDLHSSSLTTDPCIQHGGRHGLAQLVLPLRMPFNVTLIQSAMPWGRSLGRLVPMPSRPVQSRWCCAPCSGDSPPDHNPPQKGNV